jgi:hypothetical protein
MNNSIEPEKPDVPVENDTKDECEDWLKLSKASLLKTWDNEADDVFNELRKNG